MNEVDLDEQLKRARVPDRPEDYWETFPQRVLARLDSPRTPRLQSRWTPRLAWGFGIALAALIVGFVIGRGPGSVHKPDAFALLQNEKALRQVLTMFPNRIRAIVQNQQGLQLVLSDQADVPDSTPLWIEVCDGKECRAIVTFSGQELQIAREKVEVLVDAQGDIRLVGNQLYWSSTEPGRELGRLRIQAHPLVYAL